jgi:hypothetical protein
MGGDMFRFLAFAFLLSVLCAPISARAANCSVSITPKDNQTVQGTMTVKAGKSCSVGHGGSAGPMLSTVIAQRPAHGTAGVRYMHSVIYIPKRGYVGPDAFTYVRRGLDARNNPAVRTVNVLVTVEP